jgi:hypothetical protein
MATAINPAETCVLETCQRRGDLMVRTLLRGMP